MTEGTAADFAMSCVLQTGTSGNAVLINDFDNQAAFWHSGAARQVTVSVPSDGATHLTVTKGCVNIPGTFGDVNRVFEAGYNKFLPGTFITGESGTAPAPTCPINNGTLDISQAQPTVGAVRGIPHAGTYILNIENGTQRHVGDAVLFGTTHLTSATANFQSSGVASDVGKSIVGTGIPLGDTISVVNSTSDVTLDQPASASGPAVGIDIGSTTRNSTQRMIGDLTVKPGTPSHIFSNSANFQQSDVGLVITGTGIPANSFIASRISATQATINTTVAAPGSAMVVAIIGLRDATAPQKDGVDPVLKIQTEIVGNPALIAGAPPCAANIPVGVNLQAVWNTPSKFALSPVAGDPGLYFNDLNIGLKNPLNRMQANLVNEPLIGQIAIKSSVVEFAGYVSEDTSGAASIAFPLVPTGLGQCSGTAIANTFTFNGSILSQDLAPSGYGSPGSGGFRHTTPLNDIDAADHATPVPGAASFQGEDAESVDTGVNSTPTNPIAMNVATDTFTTTLANTLVDGQEVDTACDTTVHCTSMGLTNGTVAYWVMKGANCVGLVCSANQFQLSLKAHDATNGVPTTPIVKVNITSNTNANTLDVFYGAFTAVGSALGNSCTIQRPVVLTNMTNAFPCPNN